MANNETYQSTTPATLPNATVVSTFNGDTAVMQVVAQANVTAAVAAAAAAAAIHSGACKLAHILVTASGTAELDFYDNASAASGTKVAVIPAGAPIGVYVFNMPCANGIYCNSGTNTPAVTVAYAN